MYEAVIWDGSSLKHEFMDNIVLFLIFLFYGKMKSIFIPPKSKIFRKLTFFRFFFFFFKNNKNGIHILEKGYVIPKFICLGLFLVKNKNIFALWQ